MALENQDGQTEILRENSAVPAAATRRRGIEPEETNSDYSAFEAFLQGAVSAGSSHVVYVYKLSDRKGGVKGYCEKINDDEPDLDEIRNKFGAGKYNFMVSVNSAKPKSYNIDICENLSKAPTQGNALSNIREVIESVKPLLEAMRPQLAPPPPPPSQPQLMGEMMKEVSMVLGQGMREMVNQTMKSSAEMMKRARDSIMPPPVQEYDDDDDPEPEHKSDMVQLIEQFKDILPLLTGGVPSGMKKKIFMDPAYRETVRDPEKLDKAKKIIMELAPDTGAAIIDSLGLDKQPVT